MTVKRDWSNIGIGLLTLAGAAVFLLLVNGQLRFKSGQDPEIYGNFRQANGINIGSEVRLAGLTIGTVSSVLLNPENFQVQIGFTVHAKLKLPADSNARILTDGLGGKAYIDLQAGSDENFLNPGDYISYTQGSVDLLDLLSKAILTGQERAALYGKPSPVPLSPDHP